jgi:hypothetical protein
MPGCQKLRAKKKKKTSNGEVELIFRTYCNSCRRLQDGKNRGVERRRKKQRDRYHTTIKPDPELLKKVQEKGRKAYQKLKEHRNREWKELHKTTPALKNVAPSTSNFALKVYGQVFEALDMYNIKFISEFNYLTRHLYKATHSSERGLRADLLMNVELPSQKKPLILVMEAQGK